MIRHLAMNLRLNYNLFPAKGGVSSHYNSYMILPQKNWDYKKHWQVEFGAYVHASQANDPNNTDSLRTLDEIYLCFAPNFQGGHHIMNL